MSFLPRSHFEAADQHGHGQVFQNNPVLKTVLYLKVFSPLPTPTLKFFSMMLTRNYMLHYIFKHIC